MKSILGEKWKLPAAEKKKCCKRGNQDRFKEISQHEKSHFHSAVFQKITNDFRFTFRKIERYALRFSEARGAKENEAERL